MYDSVTAGDIPKQVGMVAGYVNGRFAWSQADWDRFPQATKVRIATRANVNDGHVLDVESGAASVVDAPGWAVMRRKAGVVPTVYCSSSIWDAVRRQFETDGVAQPSYWIARYDGIAKIPAGAVAKQYRSPDTGSGGHYDVSIVADYWPGVDGGNVSPTQPTLTEIVEAIKFQVLAGDWRFEGNRNPIDMAAQSVATGFANRDALAAVLTRQSELDARLTTVLQHVDSLASAVNTLLNSGVRLTASGEIVVSAVPPTG